MLNQLFEQFDHIILLDIETTGLDPRKDEIIEFGALRVGRKDIEIRGAAEVNLLIRLTAGKVLPAAITKLTGITSEMLEKNGVSKETAGGEIVKMLDVPKPLVVAYNAQFDLCFLYYFLKSLGAESVLRKARFLDALTVYKDRRDYPHKLENALETYALTAQNTHRAIDDARAALELMYAMASESDDLARYINLFGYNSRYGISGPRISSIRYVPQSSYARAKKAYEETPTAG
jgi:DNA polymerase-3 subunit epsilon